MRMVTLVELVKSAGVLSHRIWLVETKGLLELAQGIG